MKHEFNKKALALRDEAETFIYENVKTPIKIEWEDGDQANADFTVYCFDDTAEVHEVAVTKIRRIGISGLWNDDNGWGTPCYISYFDVTLQSLCRIADYVSNQNS